MEILKEFLTEAVCIGADLIVIGITYAVYKRRLSTFEAIRDAELVEIDNDLDVRIRGKYENDTIPYAMVCGRVKASDVPLKSKHIPEVHGVIQKNITRECHKVEGQYLRILSFPKGPEIRKTFSVVDFKLISPRFFKRGYVEIKDILSAVNLPMLTVYEKFSPTDPKEAIDKVDILAHGHVKGFHEVEKMLIEGSQITAVGELKVIDGECVLKPPSNKNLPYILTFQPRDGILNEYRSGVRYLRVLLVLLGCVGTGVALWTAYKWIKRMREEEDDS